MKISVDNVKKIIDPIADTLLGVSLSNHGEPLLNQDISKLIQYLHEKNIAVSFPTCLSVKMNDSEIEGLVASGADTIAISLDGLSDETYSQYRILGKFDLVISNVKRLHDAKKKLGLKRPRLLWKFIIFEHNKHESQKVREEYRNLGFDDYEMVIDVNSAGYKSTRSKKLRKSCFWPWHTMMIDWDGKVAPCCTHSDFELGNAINSNTSDLWVSPQYISLREGFSDRSKLHPICKRCLGYSINL
jgi:radical SAM protein with 4Fe4S-binding SPASM domain